MPLAQPAPAVHAVACGSAPSLRVWTRATSPPLIVSSAFHAASTSPPVAAASAAGRVVSALAGRVKPVIAGLWLLSSGVTRGGGADESANGASNAVRSGPARTAWTPGGLISSQAKTKVDPAA